MSNSVRDVPLYVESEEGGMARGVGVWSPTVGVQKLNQKRNTKSKKLCPLFNSVRNSEAVIPDSSSLWPVW